MRRLGRIVASLAGCVALESCVPPPPGQVSGLVRSSAGHRELVQTVDGAVSGVSAPQGRVFLGLPFAAPPVGGLRFKPPGPVAPWRGVRDASRPAPVCIQRPYPGAGRQSEDCLTLNVYTPAGVARGRPWPVMVWIYGGGFEIGADDQYDPSLLVQRQGVVFVAANYRLGSFGFLAHPALRGGGEGGYALQDQQAALRWVRDNIDRFGGDPHDVTLIGESAGAWSVCYQLTSPAAAGLFQRAILESGTCTAPNAALALPDAEAGGKTLAAELGCGDIATAADCLRALPATQLRDAKKHRRGLMGEDSWSPAFGGDVLPLAPGVALRQGRAFAVPMIVGVNRDEGRLFLALNGLRDRLWTRGSYARLMRSFFGGLAPQVTTEYAQEARGSPGLAYADVVTDAIFACPTLSFETLMSRRTRVFAYEFDDPQAVLALPRAPFLPAFKAYHSAEIAYVLGTRWAMADPARFDAAQRRLAARIQAYWGGFARTGDPNAAGLPPWPVNTLGPPLRLSPAGVAADAGFAGVHRCAFWNALGY